MSVQDQPPEAFPGGKRILANFSSLAAAQAVVKALYFFLLVLVARLISAEGFGRISYALLYAGLFAFLYDFGLFTIALRNLAAIPAQQLNQAFGRALSTRLVQTACAPIVMVAFGWVLGFREGELIVLAVVSTGIVLTNLAEFLHIPFMSHDRMGRSALLLIAERLLVVSAAAIALSLYGTEVAFALGFLIGAAASLILATAVLIKSLGSFRISAPSTELWKESYPIGLNMFFYLIYLRSGVIFVEYLHGAVEVGKYNAAFLFLFMIQLAVGLLMISLFPSMSRLYKESVPMLRKLYSRVTLGTLLLVIPLIAVGSLSAEWLLKLSFGVEFEGVASVLRILLWACAWNVFNSLAGHVLRATDRQVKIAWITFMGACVAVTLNVLLIGSFSLEGAAFAILGAEVLIGVLCVFILYRDFEGFEHPVWIGLLVLLAFITSWVSLSQVPPLWFALILGTIYLILNTIAGRWFLRWIRSS